LDFVDTSSRRERVAVPGRVGRLLRRLDGERRVLGGGDQHCDLVVGRAAAGNGLVDGEHARDLAVRVGERHEQRVVGVPRARIEPVGGGRRDVGRHHRLPLELPGGDVERAAPVEPGVEERRPRRPPIVVPRSDSRASGAPWTLATSKSSQAGR
jgi:hypothetical protein